MKQNFTEFLLFSTKKLKRSGESDILYSLTRKICFIIKMLATNDGTHFVFKFRAENESPGKLRFWFWDDLFTVRLRKTLLPPFFKYVHITHKTLTTTVHGIDSAKENRTAHPTFPKIN